MKRLSAIFLAAMTTLLQGQGDLLDLTKIPSPQQEKTTAWGAGTVSSGPDGVTNRIAPLTITLLSLDKDGYHLKEEVIYEVSIKNTSEAPVVIPWEPDWTRVEQGRKSPPPSYVAALITLAVTDLAPPKKLRIASRGIYGSALAEGSLKRLEPGQEVTIRAAGRWHFINQQGALSSELPATVQVQARFTYLYPPSTGHDYAPALSVNSVGIDLKPSD